LGNFKLFDIERIFKIANEIDEMENDGQIS